MGYIVITQLALTYASYAGLGVLQAAEREVPIESARGNDSVVDAMERVALSVSLIGSLIAGLVLVVFALTLPGLQDPLMVGTLIVSAGILLSQQVGLAGIIRLRTRLRFKLVAGVTTVSSLAFVAAVLSGAVLAGIWGALVATVVISSALAAFIAMVAGYRPRFGGFQTAGKRITRLAPGFLFSSLAFALLLSADQLATAFILGTASLGLYSAALLGKGFVLAFPSMVGSVIYPRLQRELGTSDDRLTVGRMATRTTALVAMAMPLVVAFFYVGLPPVIRAFMPEFTDAVPAVRLLLLAAGVLAFGIPAVQLLLTLNRQWLEAAITGSVFALLAVALAVTAWANLLTVTSVAALTAVAYLAHGLTVQLVAARVTGLPAGTVLGHALVVALPMTVLLVSGPGTDHYGEGGDGSVVSRMAGQLVPFLLVWAISCYLLFRRDEEIRRDVALVARVVAR
jgi:O-antigen/teichoic acid export membrane protein